jgi:transcriptional repressor NF-X1
MSPFLSPSLIQLFRCFCGFTPEPKPPCLSTPHSCANRCSRPRPCGHQCPLSCHPGPCPPCQIMTQLPCHCGRQKMSFKCSRLVPGRSMLASETSCGEVCGKRLKCRNHFCGQVCHEGDCDSCEIREESRCYCGKVVREISCGEGEEKDCSIDAIDGRDVQKWTGRFDCDHICGRYVRLLSPTEH